MSTWTVAADGRRGVRGPPDRFGTPVRRTSRGRAPRVRQELIELAEAGTNIEFSFGGDHGQALINSVRAMICLARGDGPGAEVALVRAYAAAVESRDLPILAMVAVSAPAWPRSTGSTGKGPSCSAWPPGCAALTTGPTCRFVS